jgi:hypothetical protein
VKLPSILSEPEPNCTFDGKGMTFTSDVDCAREAIATIKNKISEKKAALLLLNVSLMKLASGAYGHKLLPLNRYNLELMRVAHLSRAAQ